MRIAIIGAGGVGSYYGANLAAAGAEVFFIARGDHYRAMKESGLRIDGEVGAQRFDEVEVYETAAEVVQGNADVVLSCVKMYDAEEAAKICASVLKEDGIAFSLQNGIDGPAVLEAELGERRALAASVIISAFIESPGVVRHVGSNQVINLEKQSGLATEFFHLCAKAGFEASQVEDPQVLLWKKFVRLVPLSGASVLCRAPMGFVAENEHLRFVLRKLVEETIAVGKAVGVALDESIVDGVMARIDKSPYEFKPSLLLDIERKRKNEAAWLSGRVIELGRQSGVATPYNDSVWAVVQGIGRREAS